MRLGVCYYPEHWPEEWWADDAQRMAAMGLTRVRIGEFAWSRIEPEPGRYDWGWLDRAIETLASNGLGIILGTPTATPPKWLVDQMPDMLALDRHGSPRKFGSRRHYCFSHLGYRAECTRIVSTLAQRYGNHPAIVAWQTDNEYGCHDTAISYSSAAAAAFRSWLKQRHQTIGALNVAWGNVFWSMEYRSFDEIDPPNQTVTEPNPAHVIDWRRFASDEVASFNRQQCETIRAYAPGRDVVHNFMGFFTQFDHHDVSRDLDVATWDSYPLGFLDQFWFPEHDKLRYARTGHPDIAAFHHDLYRGCANGRWWVMEQQPGPVNWAANNPAPLPGMVRLWTIEAMAHGAELVSYFRWRQAPFAQEQMHAGLLRPDRVDDVGAHEARQAAADIAQIGDVGSPPKSVALIFSYEAAWVFDTQPQGDRVKYLELVFAFYTALRRLGLDIDIVSPDADLADYALVVVPSLPIVRDALAQKLARLTVPILYGPRTASKTSDFAIPATLPPGALQAQIPIKVVRVESLRAGMVEDGDGFKVARWLEYIETEIAPEFMLNGGRGVVFAHANVRYLAAWPDEALLAQVFGKMAADARIETTSLPADIRIRRSGDLCFAFNYGPQTHIVDQFGEPFIGSQHIAPAGFAVWRLDSPRDQQ